MMNDLIHDRGRGPEIRGTRITVYNLMPHFLDPDSTEEYIAKIYDLTVEQVAAARASVFANADTVLARHLEIEARLAAGNPPEVIERARLTRDDLLRFKEWLALRQAEDREIAAASSKTDDGSPEIDRLPSFREWLAQEAAQPATKS